MIRRGVTAFWGHAKKVGDGQPQEGSRETSLQTFSIQKGLLRQTGTEFLVGPAVIQQEVKVLNYQKADSD